MSKIIKNFPGEILPRPRIEPEWLLDYLSDALPTIKLIKWADTTPGK
jgi:hypothetical protein